MARVARKEKGKNKEAAKRQWSQQSFRERFAANQQIRRLLPCGTVGGSLLTDREGCSPCDERTAKNRPVASAFALQRLRRSYLSDHRPVQQFRIKRSRKRKKKYPCWNRQTGMDQSGQMEMGNPQTQRTVQLQSLKPISCGQQQQMQLSQLQQQVAVAQHQRGISINTVEEEPRNPVPQRHGLVDAKTLGKLEVLKGETTDFPDWSFIFNSYVVCINPHFAGSLERAESSKLPTPNRFLKESEKALSTQLYFVLVMF